MQVSFKNTHTRTLIMKSETDISVQKPQYEVILM